MTRAFTADGRRLTGLRLTAQGISAPLGDDPLGTVRHMLALQAQDLPGARWSIGLRTAGATDRAVGAALDAGRLVRSWPMRGTLHIVAPEDLGWMLSLTSERTVRAMAGRYRTLGISPDDVAAARRTADRVLADGPVQRKSLLAAIAADGQSIAGLRGADLILTLAVTGAIVFGPMDGAQPTFVDYDSRVPAPRIRDRDEALAEFVGRYLLAHGPASIRDFSWWSALTLADARRGLDIARDRVERITVDGVEYWHAPGLEPAPRGVWALPGFDEYLLGYQDRRAALHADHGPRIVPGNNGMFMPTIVVDGEVVGTWRRTIGAKGVSISAEHFGAAGSAAGFRSAARRYADFLGLDATVSV